MNETEEIVYEKGFPIWKYHQTLKPDGKIFYSQAELSLAGAGWVGSTADFGKEDCPVIENCEEQSEIKEEKKSKRSKK